MIKDGEPAEAARLASRVEEAVDHRQTVPEQIGDADADQIAGPAVGGGQAVFDQMGPNGRILDHGHIVEPAHIAHATARMAAVEIAPQQVKLFSRSLCLDEVPRQIRIPFQNLAL